MRFHLKDKVHKTILVISDLHLGAGVIVSNRFNFLEDFHYDKELVELLQFYSTGDYAYRDVELVVNGDFFDFLAVPFIPYFDDMFWSEDAALEKLKMIIAAHPQVIEGMIHFLQTSKKEIVYILGNHDGEIILPAVKKYLKELFPEDCREHFIILEAGLAEYTPVSEILIKHGHEYDASNHYQIHSAIIQDNQGKNYFLPPWGSYYVTRVVNKYKKERPYLNSVRPFKKFVIDQLIYDTFFMLRFLASSLSYFLKVRIWNFWQKTKNFKKILKQITQELTIYKDDDALIEELFENNSKLKCLVVGHTHIPNSRIFPAGAFFINTGSWTKMYHLNLGARSDNVQLTYAQIDLSSHPEGGEGHQLEVALNVWRGFNTLPYTEF